MTKRFRLVTLVTLGIAAPGCSNGVAPGQIISFAEARERWASVDLQSYQFEYNRICFCPPQARGPALVTVKNGVVSQVELINPSPGTGEPILDAFLTVDEIFQIIETAIDEGWETLEVEYDAVLGYPTTLAVDPFLNVADDESSYTLSRVTKLQE